MQEIIGTRRSRFGIVLSDRVYRVRWELMIISLVALVPAWLVHTVLQVPFPVSEIIAFGSQYFLWRVVHDHWIPGVMNALYMTAVGFLLAHTAWKDGPMFWSLAVMLVAIAMAYGCAVNGETQVRRWRVQR